MTDYRNFTGLLFFNVVLRGNEYSNFFFDASIPPLFLGAQNRFLFHVLCILDIGDQSTIRILCIVGG
jgi:hypothetical protein